MIQSRLKVARKKQILLKFYFISKMDYQTFNGRKIINLLNSDVTIISEFSGKQVLVIPGKVNEGFLYTLEDVKNKDVTSFGVIMVFNDEGSVPFYKVKPNDLFPTLSPLSDILPPEQDGVYYIVTKTLAYLNYNRKDLIFPTKPVYSESQEIIGFNYLNMFKD